MLPKSSRARISACALIAGVITPLAAAGQQPLDASAQTYEREIFHYRAADRVDPFRPLIHTGDVGVRVEDLELRGIMHHNDPAQSVAVLTQAGTDRRVQARVGQRIGTLRIVGIHPDRVDVVVEELGVARSETLRLMPRVTSRAEGAES